MLCSVCTGISVREPCSFQPAIRVCECTLTGDGGIAEACNALASETCSQHSCSYRHRPERHRHFARPRVRFLQIPVARQRRAPTGGRQGSSEDRSSSSCGTVVSAFGNGLACSQMADWPGSKEPDHFRPLAFVGMLVWCEAVGILHPCAPSQLAGRSGMLLPPATERGAGAHRQTFRRDFPGVRACVRACALALARLMSVPVVAAARRASQTGVASSPCFREPPCRPPR